MSLRRVHACLTVLWLLTIPPVCLTSLRNSVPLLVLISIYANVAGHFSAWEATRAKDAINDNT